MDTLAPFRSTCSPEVSIAPPLPLAPVARADSVNESIVPAANPKADEDMRQQMEQLRQQRGRSRLEQHQQRTAKEEGGGGGGGASRRAWDR